MGRPLCLRPRLMEIARRIPPGHRVADVGVDHGRLPVFLIERGLAKSVVATDRAEAPLRMAAVTLKTHRLSDKIRLLLCDGLDAIGQDDVDTVVVAGMGGETIAGILARSPWTKTKNLLLQPMTKIDRLLDFLLAQDYGIPETILVPEGRREYTILHVGEKTS